MPASSGVADTSIGNDGMFETLIRGATIVNAEGLDRRRRLHGDAGHDVDPRLLA